MSLQYTTKIWSKEGKDGGGTETNGSNKNIKERRQIDRLLCIYGVPDGSFHGNHHSLHVDYKKQKSGGTGHGENNEYNLCLSGGVHRGRVQ